MHITASVFINDDESGLHNDFEPQTHRNGPRSHRRRNRWSARLRPVGANILR
jgi:thiamine phosphate synthase YjbQ (UPF0047 family)